ncbi:MAG TPA: serine hydrolase domain-containing protein, partial [Steroidobacteraceae bacterium]|nr:serine hydrolase domain-containing protein [Steroidobacteraceae bacterium]
TLARACSRTDGGAYGGDAVPQSRDGRVFMSGGSGMQKIIGSLALILTALALPALGAPTDSRVAPLQQVLDQLVAGNRRLGVVASVDAPSLRLKWSGAAGALGRDSTVRLQPNQPFRIASVTKVYVAAAVIRLIEDGRLGLYDPITLRISSETADALKSGGYDPARITVAELLGHTSGIATFGPSDAYERAVMEHQKAHKVWTRAEQIEFTMEHEKPVGQPGEKYYYSDTAYIVLGEIIERVSGKSLAAYVRQSLKFNELHLKSTYWEKLEPQPKGLPARAHQYWGDVDVTGFDPSLDLFGGGGIVSTTADLNEFFRALLTGRVFRRPSTLSLALLPVRPEKTIEHPRALMIAARQFGRHECWAHGGYWGTTAMYCPDIDAAVSMTIDQTLDDKGAAENMRQVLDGLAAALDQLAHPAG